MASNTVLHRLFDNARTLGDAPALVEKRANAWVPISWKGYARLTRRVARALLALGFERGDTVAILGFNRVEWVVTALGAMAAGGAAAGIYTTCSADEVGYIVQHSEARVLLVENKAQWAKVAERLGELPRLAKVVLMRDAEAVDHPQVLRWEAFLALGEAVDDARVDERVEALEPGGLSTLIYTSGTTGPPKAVMLSHDNVAFTASMAQDVIDATGDDVLLSYLPLSHIAEQVLSVHGAITIGAKVYFAEALEKVPENLKEVQPTIFFGVPRIWEKFHAAIAPKLAAATGPKAKLLAAARHVAREHNRYRNAGLAPPAHLAVAYRAMDKLVFGKLKAALGLNRARRCVTGAAPIAREVLEFFNELDLVVQEVYGQSEDTGPATFNRFGRVKFGTVGQPLPGVDVRIADDGEILVKGRTVFMGYYKDPAATAETLTADGWLRSGDLGSLDGEGFLSITGRKKEIIITSGGKNITPANIEGALKNHPLVNEAVLIGDRRKFLSALLAVDPEAAVRFQRAQGVAEQPPHECPAVRAALQRAIDEVNQAFARVEQIKKFYVLPRLLTVEHGELTPTLKVKRRIVAQNWAREIDALYEGADAAG